MKIPRTTALIALLATGLLGAQPQTSGADALFTTVGNDFTIEQLVKMGSIVPGQNLGQGPVPGSRVVVNHEALEELTGKLGPFDPKHVGGIQHPAGHGSRRTIERWMRWYQEDGNTQVFRLMKGDQNFRGGIGETSKPGRIEAYTKPIVVQPGTWREWEGTYTIIKPLGCSIFQLFHSGGQLWAFHLGMNSNGDIHFKRRGNPPGLKNQIVLAENMVGKPLSIKVRTNGFDFQIFKKRPLEDSEWLPVTTGTYQKAENNQIQFRWGMYLGQKKGASVGTEAMHLVSGVIVR